ncbi:hypothetical protein PGT21_036811 [Puccinia graminis f. sp. tritici]|uniref:Uncharacterized protein n=1 Tax=Puccinia graminis f. sp. tritici TaxID=56615 RepID=A0A5B0MM57_PUCGR|nr:hypothetical protein PGTUg99_000820 [Puccinia graminis f. sp. tritici]KAA1098601.1 hypothetical protein PGT21_036811 [Puccinia graminis f. sp. tritici]
MGANWEAARTCNENLQASTSTISSANHEIVCIAEHVTAVNPYTCPPCLRHGSLQIKHATSEKGSTTVGHDLPSEKSCSIGLH